MIIVLYYYHSNINLRSYFLHCMCTLVCTFCMDTFLLFLVGAHTPVTSMFCVYVRQGVRGDGRGSEGGTRTYPQRMADRHHRRLLRKSLTMLTQLLLPTLMWMTSLPLPQLPPLLLPRARCSPIVWPLSLQLSSQWASLPASLLARGRPKRRCCWRWLPCSADSLLLLSLSLFLSLLALSLACCCLLCSALFD